MARVLQVLFGVAWCMVQIATFWQRRLWAWYWRQSKRDMLLDTLNQARLYEEWEAASYTLDQCMEYDLWRQNPASKHYDHRLIHQRLSALYDIQEQGDIEDLINYIRSGLVRNLGNILASKLYNRAYNGTKMLIEDYITEVVRSIEIISHAPTAENGTALSGQEKLDALHDTRVAFGRSALVLQGGAIFGMCHLGVVKALHLQGLLPRIIAGTATGAIIAALVCVHTEDELLHVLSGRGINVEAFATKNRGSGAAQTRWYETLNRRIRRWWKLGHFLDVHVLEEVLRTNIGDITFEQAYERTKRVLNITVTTNGGGGGMPNLLNYITAPNVLIWSAALASNATTSSTLYHPVVLFSKDHNDEIVPWPPALHATFGPWTHASYRDRQSPLHRLGELFNVNHYIISQARPYIAPFLRSDTHHPHPKQFGRWRLTMPILRLVLLEIQHRLQQLDQLGLLSPSIRRFLLDEQVPGASLTIVPELSPGDFFKLLEHPTREAIDYWIHKGERSVWPAVTALKIRLAIEFEIDRGYQLVRRRRRPSKKKTVNNNRSSADVGDADKSGQQLDRRPRAMSFGTSTL
ncbi:triacylglycerol lipase [Pleosporales sp. CAS-2024a]